MSGHTWGRPVERGCGAELVSALLVTLVAWLVGERVHRFAATGADR